MTKNVTFTPASIDALTKGKLRDPRTSGLMIDVLPSGRKVWKYERRLIAVGAYVRLTLGRFPAYTLADARARAATLNEQVEAGIDPREAARAAEARASMTVDRAHQLYMVAVHEGRASRAKRKNRPRTIADKQKIYDRDVPAKLKKASIYAITEKDLMDVVIRKGKTAKVRANRLAAELKVFFGWAASLRGLEVGLESDPSRRLGDLRFPEPPRSRKLSLLELEWFLKALAEEPRWVQRGMLLWLLTAARISEVAQAKSAEVVNGVWTIPGRRSKNSFAHSIALGPWGRSLMLSNHEWVFPATRIEGPRNNSVWYKARDRVRARMAIIAGRPIERFTPHDFRRTARSNTKRLKVDFETAEAMMNHLRSGMERIYDGYELEEEKAAWFLKWELRPYSLEEMAGIIWLHSTEKLGQPGLARATCLEIAARMQCAPRPSVNILEPLISSFYGAAEESLGRVPSRAEVAERITADAVAGWFEQTLGLDANGLSPDHRSYLSLLRTRGAAAEEEIRRALGISNRGDFIAISEYLTRLDLIRVGPGGRTLTPDGRRYLSSPTLPDFRERISRRSI